MGRTQRAIVAIMEQVVHGCEKGLASYTIETGPVNWI
jgi:hypothetical protein